MKLRLPVLLLLFSLALICSCQNEQELEFKRYFASGRVVYQQHCQNCHGSGGEGLGKLIPPLTDTAYIKKEKSNLACYINYGMEMPITVYGKAYYQKMPAANLSPVEIAEVVTYIASSFGNKLGTLTTAQANQQLRACK